MPALFLSLHYYNINFTSTLLFFYLPMFVYLFACNLHIRKTSSVSPPCPVVDDPCWCCLHFSCKWILFYSQLKTPYIACLSLRFKLFSSWHISTILINTCHVQLFICTIHIDAQTKTPTCFSCIDFRPMI